MRDIWSWLSSAEVDLGIPIDSQLAPRIFDAGRRHDTEGVRTATRELSDIARDHHAPWLQVVAQHWALQYRLRTLEEGSSAMPDATGAYEFAHRPENLQCPQSICATQDLALCYRRTDAPGYAQQVIDACCEALDRIDPSWPCFDCVSVELASALLAAGRYEDAIAVAEDAAVALRSTGSAPNLDLETVRIDALLALDRVSEAAQIVSRVDVRRFSLPSTNEEPSFRRAAARVLLRQDDAAAACRIWRGLPSAHEHPDSSAAYVALADELLEAGVLANDDTLSTMKVRLAFQARDRGAVRDAFQLFCSAAVWAARRGARRSALRAAALAGELRHELTQPMDADLCLSRVRAEIDEAPGQVCADAPLDALVERWCALLERGELDPRDSAELASALLAQGWQDAAREVTRAQALARPDDLEVASTAFFTTLSSGDLAEAARYQAQVAGLDPRRGRWCAANLAAARLDWRRCASLCADLVSHEDTAVIARRLWSIAAIETGDLLTGAQLSAEVLELADAPEPDDAWRAAVNGSLAQDWDLVRRACALLGMPLQSRGPGPVEESWGECLVMLRTDDGRQTTLSATRTGPATARICQVAPPGAVQHCADLVVIDPRATEPPEAATGEPGLDRYRALATLQPGGMRSFEVVGVYPGEDAWLDLREALRGAGFPVWRYASDRLRLATGEVVDDLYLAVAAPRGSDLAPLVALLTRHTSGWSPPPAWRSLAHACGIGIDEQESRAGALVGEPA
ncbi:MAG: hypothetical protein ACK5MT_18900 [Actinomycetales bacterium]